MTGAGPLSPGPPGVARPAVAGVLVAPSQPGQPSGGRWPLVSYMTYGPLRDSAPTARARAKVVLREWGARAGDLVMDDINRFFRWAFGRFVGERDEPPEHAPASPPQPSEGQQGPMRMAAE